MGEGRRLGEQLEGQPMAGIVGVQQVAREGQQLAAVFGHPALVDRVELVEPGLGLRRLERGLVGGHADLAAAELAGDMHHLRGSCEQASTRPV